MGSKRWMMATLALSAVACNDGPTAPEGEITLYFCEVAWAAYQNEGEPWTAFPSTPRAVTFVPTDRLVIATVRSGSSEFRIFYLTAEQAREAFSCGAPASTTPTKLLNGSVAGVPSDAYVVVSTGTSAASASATSPTFQVRAARDGPTDLVATRTPSTSTSPPLIGADRVIIRREESYADGATMPVLDFSSSEAFAPQSNTVTIEGWRFQPTQLSGTTTFTTQRGASELMKYELKFSGTTVMTTSSVPASHLADGDLHRAEVWSPDWGFLFYYRTPADRTLSVGPDVSLPVFTKPATTADHWVRIEVPGQPVDYGSRIEVVLDTPQPSTSIRFIRISATKEYFGGTPTTWTVEVPNLSGLAGFSPEWGVSPGEYSWRLTASGVPNRPSSSAPRDGDMYRSGSTIGFVPLGP